MFPAFVSVAVLSLMRTVWFCNPALFFSLSFWCQNKALQARQKNRGRNSHKFSFSFIFFISSPVLVEHTVCGWLSKHSSPFIWPSSPEEKPQLDSLHNKTTLSKPKASWLSNFPSPYTRLSAHQSSGEPGLPSMPKPQTEELRLSHCDLYKLL